MTESAPHSKSRTRAIQLGAFGVCALLALGAYARRTTAPALDVVAASLPSALPSVMPIAEAPLASQNSAPASPPSSVASDEPLVPFDESDLMARLRSVRGAEPNLAVLLAREGNQRFPDSADAPERSSILIHALSALGRASEARGEAEQMVNHYPDSTWVREVEAFTGAHRHRNLRATADGRLESY